MFLSVLMGQSGFWEITGKALFMTYEYCVCIPFQTLSLILYHEQFISGSRLGQGQQTVTDVVYNRKSLSLCTYGY